MAGGKETPRQKMIGMMYLFLTAMLALNVSKEVLHSFVLVNDSLSATVDNFTEKNKSIYNDFEKQASMNEEKVGKWRDLANQVKAKSNEINEYIKELKVEVVQAADGDDAPAITEDGDIIAEKIEAKDNLDVGGEVMVVKGRGPVLKEKIIEFREFLLENTDPSHTFIRKSINKNLNTDDPPAEEGSQVSWTSHHFSHMPLAAVLTMLTKTQSDIRNAEADILRYFYGQISAQDFKFNDLEPVVLPTKSNYVLKGTEYEAEVFIAAQDTTQKPSIYIGDYQQDENGRYRMVGSYDSLEIKNGRGIYQVRANTRGDKEWGGLIAMRAPDGSIQQFPFEAQYKVEVPTAIISASANRVFYYGVANPLEVSVPGLRKDQLKPTATNARIVPHKGGLAVKPSKKGGKIKVSLYADIDNQRKLIGSSTFSVKQIPPPTPVLQPINVKFGDIAKGELGFADRVDAKLEGFIMEDINYKVISFTVSTTDEGFTVDEEINGDRFNQAVTQMIQKASRNQKITFEDIKAEGPDGIKELSPMVFTIK